MEENDENDYLSDLEDVSIKYEGYERNNNINYETNVIKKFNVCFYFDLNKDKKYSFNFNTDEFNADEYHIYNLIKFIVKKINDDEVSIYIKHEIDENGRVKETRYYGEFCPKCGKVIVKNE